MFNAGFNTNKPPQTSIYSNTASIFSADPFGEDPFVKEDPFADSDFTKQDPFETEFATQKLLNRLGSSPRTVQFSSKELSSESESAPEPPPRPAATLGELQPPPLPPKKQSEIVVKPPPRPPHSEDGRYDYIETVSGVLGEAKNLFENSPPLPVPQRKSKFDSEFTIPPERPRKQGNSLEDDYLTPVPPPSERSVSPGVVLPPPQRQTKKEVTVASFLENKPSLTTTTASEGFNNSLEGLDMTLSQLTLSGLNELANKLKIPPHKLSNMTLVQLTNYLSTFIKSQSSDMQTSSSNAKENPNNTFPAFQADFASNFGSNNGTTISDSTFDKYAVFRELQEEIKQTRIDTEPEEIVAEKEVVVTTANSSNEDKYAALREIVEIELTTTTQVEKNLSDTVNEDQLTSVEDINAANREQKTQQEMLKENIMEYMVGQKSKSVTPEKSPARSPIMKSPVPSAITEIIQANARLTSGSLSDVLSGSSPEIDNTGSNSDIAKKHLDPTGKNFYHLFILKCRKILSYSQIIVMLLTLS